VSQFKYKYKKN